MVAAEDARHQLPGSRHLRGDPGEPDQEVSGAGLRCLSDALKVRRCHGDLPDSGDVMRRADGVAEIIAKR
ncbi:hypothetical protein GCM10012289_36390 [Nonomuraea cavernae]|uniref:Uncharacterized protein n=1 Tax=Nonomuraea cavernae TaxID=2045107 RepID=A0A918DK30_9ACTN|nr:hypothetical protein GCM10012289_36390 [Nonomuraea cavernae]